MGSTFPTGDEDLDNFITVDVTLGWDFAVSNWIISPEIRVGEIPFAQPGIFIYQAILGIGHHVFILRRSTTKTYFDTWRSCRDAVQRLFGT